MEIPNSLLDQHASTVGPYGLAVLVTLIRFDRQPISYQQIADYTGMTRRHAIDVVKQLMSAGLVQRLAIGYVVLDAHSSSDTRSPDYRLSNNNHQKNAEPQSSTNTDAHAPMWAALIRQYGIEVVNAVRPAFEVKLAAGAVRSISGLAKFMCQEQADKVAAEKAAQPTPEQIARANAELAALARELESLQDEFFSQLEG